jgi:hypothetical protein
MKIVEKLRSKLTKKVAFFVTCFMMVATLALSVSAASDPAPVVMFDEAVLATIGPAIVGVINALLPIGIAIMIPILGLRLIPRIVYMFL